MNLRREEVAVNRPWRGQPSYALCSLVIRSLAGADDLRAGESARIDQANPEDRMQRRLAVAIPGSMRRPHGVQVPNPVEDPEGVAFGELPRLSPETLAGIR